MRVVKTILSDDGDHRLQILADGDIFRASEDARATTYDGEQCWTPAWPSGVYGMIADTAEIAEAEARARIPWLTGL